jgi:glycerol uptake facilitator-like aquaporin
MVANKTIDGATYVSYLAAQFFGAFLSVAWYQGAYKNCQPKTAP